MTPPMSGHLRAMLEPVHDAFEASNDIRERLRSMAGYASLLRALHAVHEPAEAALAPYAALFRNFGIDVRERAKVPLLEAEERLAQAAPPCAPLAVDIATPGEAWGWLYVLEGSTLGGVILAREIQQQLDIRSRYYGCYGQATAPMWRSFTTALDAYHLSAPASEPAIVAGARAAYACFATVFAGASSARA